VATYVLECSLKEFMEKRTQRTYEISIQMLDGTTLTRTQGAEDGACALGVVLDREFLGQDPAWKGVSVRPLRGEGHVRKGALPFFNELPDDF